MGDSDPSRLGEEGRPDEVLFQFQGFRKRKVAQVKGDGC